MRCIRWTACSPSFGNVFLGICSYPKRDKGFIALLCPAYIFCNSLSQKFVQDWDIASFLSQFLSASIRPEPMEPPISCVHQIKYIWKENETLADNPTENCGRNMILANRRDVSWRFYSNCFRPIGKLHYFQLHPYARSVLSVLGQEGYSG